mgnify:CR=1 FL=1
MGVKGGERWRECQTDGDFFDAPRLEAAYSPGVNLPALLCLLTFLLAGGITAHGKTAFPALERFSFASADGRFTLSAVRIPASPSRGVIVFVNGRSETWLKYGSLFRDFIRAGYTVYSYDHRGQGLSPHLVPGHPQVGHVDDFAAYRSDLEVFLREVRLREQGVPLNLVGHSMGAAVIVDCVAGQTVPNIGKIVLCSPMFRINTAPWPAPVARIVLALLRLAGFGTSYAPGEHDASPDEPFSRNRVTSSPGRWMETLSLRRRHPEALTGGASVDWVAQALGRSSVIEKKAALLGPETLIMEAGRDELVIPGIPKHPRGGPAPRVLLIPDARHEILMEREPIRDRVVQTILAFLAGGQEGTDHP